MLFPASSRWLFSVLVVDPISKTCIHPASTRLGSVLLWTLGTLFMQVILCPPFPLSTRRASVAGLSDTGRPFPVPHREHVFCRHCGENFRQPNLGIVPYRDACQCHPTDTRRLRGIGLVSPNALSSVAISQFRAAPLYPDVACEGRGGG